MHIEEEWHTNTDHFSILLPLSENVIKKENNPSLVNKYTDWKYFRICLETKITLSIPLRNPQQLEEKVEVFVKNILQAAWDILCCATLGMHVVEA